MGGEGLKIKRCSRSFHFSWLFEAAERGRRRTRQFVAGPRGRSKQPFALTPTDASEFPASLTCTCFIFDCGRGGRSARREPTEARGGRASSTQRGHRAVSEASRDESSQCKMPLCDVTEGTDVCFFRKVGGKKARGRGAKKNRGLHFLLSVFLDGYGSQLFMLGCSTLTE